MTRLSINVLTETRCVWEAGWYQHDECRLHCNLNYMLLSKFTHYADGSHIYLCLLTASFLFNDEFCVAVFSRCPSSGRRHANIFILVCKRVIQETSGNTWPWRNDATYQSEFIQKHPCMPTCTHIYYLEIHFLLQMTIKKMHFNYVAHLSSSINIINSSLDH